MISPRHLLLSSALFSAVAYGQSCSDSTTVDFSGVSSGQDVAEFLSQFNMGVSNYNNVPSTPILHDFVNSNVAFGDGVLEMKVQAYSGSGNVQSSEIVSNDEFLYGSLRVTMKSSKTKGICEGIFFFKSDLQETDIELLTTTSLEASADLPAGFWTTNQAHVADEDSTSENIAFAFDPTEDFHEYRIDWTADATTFFVDGSQVNELTDNVPNVPGLFIFNAWSSGDPQWSAGPPTEDSISQISKIVLYKGFVPQDC
ncbi:glycoside hydrolase family 16 protein [Cylindrobasidium torrendii FP15055 ss-10]|uniref:Glycoside hydrolase family 16 protein n=1 Tax=Cylindrobasidium torrendii FP15055 ss-10 TaxID=1314674 RepID=A0A0D7AU42_9AGAR|nr:glycoside hydrolase family 16 protein [Cylindrobasidium torrendii FP15055 ss-10]